MSLGDATLDLQGAGAFMSAFAAFAGASGQQSNLRSQANFNDLNAKLSETTAESALAAGQRQQQQSMLQTANLKSAQQARFAANGVDLGEGSAARTIASTDIMGQIDSNTIAANAVRSAWGYRTQATNYANTADTERASADTINPTLSGATSLIGSAGSVASNWYTLNKAGALDSYAMKKP